MSATRVNNIEIIKVAHSQMHCNNNRSLLIIVYDNRIRNIIDRPSHVGLRHHASADRCVIRANELGYMYNVT